MHNLQSLSNLTYAIELQNKRPIIGYL